MRTTINKSLGNHLLCAGVWAFSTLAAAAGEPAALVLSQSIELPSVSGRLDHLTVNLGSGRVFVAALGANSVEVVDLRAGKRMARIQGLHEPQGVLYLPDLRRLLVANGSGGGVVAIEDGKPTATSSIELADADNLRFDPAEGLVYAGYAHALAVLDPAMIQIRGRIELAGHPEAFELERSGGRVYVNVPTAHHIAVVDRASGKVAETWKVEGAGQNFAMALDEPSKRLFVATRQPAALLVFDTQTGKRTVQLPMCGDADDLFFDAQRRQLYAVCGEGVVQIVHQRDADHYETVGSISTSRGARTGLFVPSLSTLLVAAPATPGSPAHLRAYSIK